MSAVDGRRGYRSQDTIQSSYINHLVYRRVDKSGDDGRGGYRSQETSHYLSHNCGSSVDVDGRGGYRS